MKRLYLFLFFIPFLLLGGCNQNAKSTTYQIGIDPSWYPLNAPMQEANIYAFSFELLSLIAKETGIQLSIQIMNWDNLVWGLEKDKYQGMLKTMRPYTFYLKEFSFSDPYLLVGPVLIVPIASTATHLSEMKGKEIAVVLGSSATLLLQSTPGIILRGYDSAALALEALANQEVDCAVIDLLLAQNYLKNLYRDRLKIINHPLNNDGLRLITLLKDSKGLIEKFNQGLILLKQKGTYEKLLKKWELSPDGALELPKKEKEKWWKKSVFRVF